MVKRLLQIIITFAGAAVMAILIVFVDWWLYVLTGRTLCVRLMNLIENSILKDYTL